MFGLVCWVGLRMGYGNRVYQFSSIFILISHMYNYVQIDITTWATSWENVFMPNANNKGADQPVHPRSLISA